MDENILNWTVQSVEKWLCNKNRVRIGICGIFRNKYKIDGSKLIHLSTFQIKHYCKEARATKSETNKVISIIQSLQTKHLKDMETKRKIQERNRKRRNRDYSFNNQRQTKRQRTNNSSNSSHHPYKYSIADSKNKNMKNYGKPWREGDYREVWWLWLKYQDFEPVARLANRSYLACLSKVNLIRRAIAESNDDEFRKNLNDPFQDCQYSLLEIVKQQDAKEKNKNQEQRLKENGLETKNEEYSSEDEESSDDDDLPILRGLNNARNRRSNQNRE